MSGRGLRYSHLNPAMAADSPIVETRGRCKPAHGLAWALFIRGEYLQNTHHFVLATDLLEFL